MKYKGSLSGLVRYAKGDGKENIIMLLDATNEKNSTNVSFGEVANIKNIIDNATESELFNSDGTEKRVFTFRILVYTLSRIVKKEKLKSLNSASTSSESIWTVKK